MMMLNENDRNKYSVNIAVLVGMLLTSLLIFTYSAHAGEVDDIIKACQVPGITKQDCYQQKLEEIISTKGTEHALDVLEKLAVKDKSVEGNAHMYVHFIGWKTLAHYKDPSIAFSHCKATFWSGCYHGVIQDYLGSLPEISPQAVADLCYKTIDAQKSSFLAYQCLHGIGHGLALNLDNDVGLSLQLCDALKKDWDRQSCYGGVFMENIGVQGHSHGHRKAQVDTSHNDNKVDKHKDHKGHPDKKDGDLSSKQERISGIKADNPLYPCNAIDRKYREQCYLMQTSAIIRHTKYSFSKAFDICDTVENEFRPTCYQSMGRDISGTTVQNTQKTIELCSLGNEKFVHNCYVGAAKNVILHYADPDKGLGFCNKVDKQFKRDCYAAVGEILVSLYTESEKGKRETVCVRAEKRYVAYCKEAARLYF